MRSLRLKLIGWFLLVLLIVLVAFGFSLYFARQHSLYASLDGELKSTALQLADQLDIDNGKVFLRSTESNLSKDLFYQILNHKEEIIAQSNNVKQYSLPLPNKAENDKDNFAVTSIPGWQNAPLKTLRHSLRMITLKKTIQEENDESENQKSMGSSNSQIVFIQCAQSTWAIDEELEELVGLIFWVGLGTFLLAGLGGFFLAGRALRPIKEITRTVQDLSETHLSERITVSQFDKEFHPLATQLNAALERLERAFQRERQFTADASHELRTPISVIINNIEVLLKRSRSPEEHIETHQSNLETAQHMQHIVEGLLILTRMDDGRITLEKEKINLHHLLEECLGDLQSKATDHQISLINQVDPNIFITVDADKFKQVLTNLLDNAITYNRPAGSITVKATLYDSRVRIQITDTGIGIPQEHLSRIFERFYRVDPSRSEKTGGCGLGLAIAKSIVELHEGTLSVISNGTGSTFTISLPIN